MKHGSGRGRRFQVQTILDGLGRAGAALVWLLAAVAGLIILVILSPVLLVARLFRRA